MGEKRVFMQTPASRPRGRKCVVPGSSVSGTARVKRLTSAVAGQRVFSMRSGPTQGKCGPGCLWALIYAAGTQCYTAAGTYMVTVQGFWRCRPNFRDATGFLLHLVCNGGIIAKIICDYVKPAKRCKDGCHDGGKPATRQLRQAVTRRLVINRYAAADACARTTPTEACVKQHLGAVAETGEEGARLLPPQLFKLHSYFRPAAMLARARRSATLAGSRRRTLCCALCPLMLYSVRLTAPQAILRLAQATVVFALKSIL